MTTGPAFLSRSCCGSNVRKKKREFRGGNATHQSRRADGVVRLALGVGHLIADLFADEVARFHVSANDGVHQLVFIAEFGRKGTFGQSGVVGLHSGQDLGLFPLRDATESDGCKTKNANKAVSCEWPKQRHAARLNTPRRGWGGRTAPASEEDEEVGREGEAAAGMTTAAAAW
jgi:hypothetical protein